MHYAAHEVTRHKLVCLTTQGECEGEKQGHRHGDKLFSHLIRGRERQRRNGELESLA